MILLLDNRDSFTFNLAHALVVLGAQVRTERSSGISWREALLLRPAGILIGPGPGTPAGAGCTEDLVRHLAQETSPPIPVLGVCLGHQALATALGGELAGARELVHGQTRPVHHDGLGLFSNLPNPLELTRYNSLVVAEPSLPAELLVSARGADGEIEGLRHRSRPLEGIQAHPEALLSLETGGPQLLEAFLSRCRPEPAQI